MASYNKGSAGGSYGAAETWSATKVWALYPHWKGSVETKKYGLSEAVRAEVYELTEGWRRSPGRVRAVLPDGVRQDAARGVERRDLRRA